MPVTVTVSFVNGRSRYIFNRYQTCPGSYGGSSVNSHRSLQFRQLPLCFVNCHCEVQRPWSRVHGPGSRDQARVAGKIRGWSKIWPDPYSQWGVGRDQWVGGSSRLGLQANHMRTPNFGNPRTAVSAPIRLLARCGGLGRHCDLLVVRALLVVHCGLLLDHWGRGCGLGVSYLL